jgi:ribosomal protein S18 acetylase RimI-like enzyme
MLHDFNLEFGEQSPGADVLEPRVADFIARRTKTFLVVARRHGRDRSGDDEGDAGLRGGEGGPGCEDGKGREDPVEAAGFAQLDFRASVWLDGPVALLEELYVRPDERGRGLGRSLMDSILQTSRSRGAQMVEVVTGEDDTAARGLYESTGFRNLIEGEDKASSLYYELEL